MTGHKEERNQTGHPDLLLERLHGSWGHYWLRRQDRFVRKKRRKSLHTLVKGGTEKLR